MARQVFFSFHYDDDILRVGQIRNSGIVLPAGDTARGFIDSASWESVKRQGEGAIKKWIDNELNGTSVTVVCAYKQGYSWLHDEVLPRLKGKPVGRIEIAYHTLKDSKEVRWQVVESETRWLQELYPIDAVMAKVTAS